MSRSFLNHFRRGIGNIIRVLAQQEAIAEVRLDFLELREERRILRGGAEGFESHDGFLAAGDAVNVAFNQLIDAGNRSGERTRTDQAENPRDPHFSVIRAGLRVRNGENRNRSRGGFRVPDRFHGGELLRLVAGREVGGFVALMDREERGHETERAGDHDGLLGEFNVSLAEQVPGGNSHHEDSARHVAGAHRVGKRGLSPFARDDGPEAVHLHTHRFNVEDGALRELHPAVGDQNPHGGNIGTESHEERADPVPQAAQPLPAEEEETGESGFHEERHQSLNRERSAENIAHVVRVVGPVRAELEFHGDTGSNAHGEVNREELAPESGHVFIDFFPRDHIAAFHGHEDHGKSESERDEEVVVKSRDSELQSRQVYKFRCNHGMSL